MMDLSDSEIRKIAGLISSWLGPGATPDEIKDIAIQVITGLSDRMNRGLLTGATAQAAAQSPSHRGEVKLVINALGPDKDGFEEKLRSFIDGRALRLTSMAGTRVANLRSVIAIIDCANFAADINRLKFELSSLCEDSGFRAIVQDSGYYGI